MYAEKGAAADLLLIHDQGVLAGVFACV